MPINEVAASLHGMDQLGGVLETLAQEAPSEMIKVQLRTWRADIRNLPGSSSNGGEDRWPPRDETTNQELGGLISEESRGGSVPMSGGLGVSADDVPGRSQQDSHHLVATREKQDSETEYADDFTRASTLPGGGDTADPKAAKRLKIQFPDRRSVFLHHVFEACKTADILLSREDCEEQALEIWSGFEKEEKQKWSMLKESLW